MNFKDANNLEERKKEAHRIKTKHPERIPIIVEKSDKCINIDNVDKNKYLVPKDLTMGQFIHILRKRINLPPEKALFLFVNKSNLVISSEILSEVYNKYKDIDGFLYIEYAGESTFG